MNPRKHTSARAQFLSLVPAALAACLASADAFAQQQQPARTTGASGGAATTTSSSGGTASTSTSSGSSGASGSTTATTAGGSGSTAGAATSGSGSTQAAASGPAATPHPVTAESAANTNCTAQATTPPTAAQIEQASRMYDQGQAQRAGQDFAAAASSFETANRFAPSRQALSMAIRAHREVQTPEHNARAATLALELRQLYGSDQRATSLADQTLQDLQAGLTRVVVNCQCCAVRADNRLRSYEFYVEPGTHNVVAEWSEQRSASHQFNAVAGQTETYNVEAPPVPPHVETHTAQNNQQNNQQNNPPPPPPPSGGIPVVVPIAAGVATVISGAILAWSAVDMYNGANAYNDAAAAARMQQYGSAQMQTAEQLLQDGRSRELRTDILIGTTVALGAITIGTVALYLMGGSSHESAPSNGGGAAAHARRHRLMFSPVTAGANGPAPGMTLQGSF